MFKTAFIVAASFILPFQAQAHPHHHPYRLQHFHRLQHFRQAMASFTGDDRIVGTRPAGCPHAFCGCEASLYKFGRIIPELNLAAHWRRFPRAAPSPGMAAVRSGHVMILQRHVAGDIWYVHDGNSGGHLTRDHARSIAGYTIVDPNSGAYAGDHQTSPSHGWKHRVMASGFM